MIISGGVNIYPAEIEAALIGHPKVADVAVFGVPDDDWGEQVKAVIVAIDDAQDAATLQAELAAYLQDKLAKFKRPRSMDFVSSLPRDPSGKLFKRKLRDPYWQGRERAI
jgi:long-chain acyl-CoA synthetase